MSCLMRPTFCICENKGTDQLHSNCEADQCLYFRYMDCTIPLLSKSKISMPGLPGEKVIRILHECQGWIDKSVVRVTLAS